jgi:formylglycine-generating enzyme required for sulfatase activity
MKMVDCSRIFDAGKRFWFWLLLLSTFVSMAVWQASTASSVTPSLKTKVNPKDALTYVWIPPGKFQMGCSPDDQNCTAPEFPVHSVTLTTGFWMGQTPVTEKAYMKVVGRNPSTYAGDQLPVENVAWSDAQA